MFKQKSETAPAPADAVRQARTRARHRFIGAIVLLAIGIIGFPLVFESQPRPIPVDIPIEIPRKDALPPLAAPSAPLPGAIAASGPAAPAATARTGARATAADPSRSGETIITESRGDAGREVLAPASRAATAASRVAAAAASAARPAAAASAGAAASTPVAARSGSEGERARALLEGRPAGADDGQRYVVQVGAFAEAEAARETRLKVEKLGLKTYTQVAQTPAGSRIRVRIGPFASRDEAEAALARTRAAGVTAVVLKL